MSDLTLICQNCGNEFIWTDGEQDFYRQKGLKPPSFCLICRAKFQARERQFAKYRKDKE